ncbi:MAG: hypothetical protein GX684_06480 [Ruminococcaceae bacterium]|nr:hypothetical protein [Oscillospiraceae bacterium]
MSPLLYLLAAKLKNMLKRFFRSPGKLIYALFLIAMMALVFFTSGKGDVPNAGALRNANELLAIIIALFGVLFLLITFSGFSEGTSIFKMADVNLLFTGPIKPMRILFYAMAQQLGVSVLTGLFIVFQYNWLNRSYGVNMTGIIAILVGYGLTIFTAQVAAMLIYILTAGSENRRRYVKLGLFVIVGAYALWIVYNLVTAGGSPMTTLVSLSSTLPIKLFPVAGWLGTAAFGISVGNMSAVALGLVLWAAFLAALLFITSKSDQDYYEDVLQSTEKIHKTLEAVKENRTPTSTKVSKVGKSGLGGGWGSSVFWYKMMLENRRQKKFFVGFSELFLALFCLGFGYFTVTEKTGVYPLLGFVAYMQLFSIELKGIGRELTRSYIYLVPEPPFKKLFWGIIESVPGFIITAIVIYVPLGILKNISPEVIAIASLWHVTMCSAVLSVNLLIRRFFGDSSKVLMFFLYVIVLIVAMAPGIALGILLTASGVIGSAASAVPLGDGPYILAVSAIWNLIASLFLIFLSRNMLNYAPTSVR